MALFRAPAPLGLDTADEIGKIRVTITVGVLNVVLQPQRIAHALSGEPGLISSTGVAGGFWG